MRGRWLVVLLAAAVLVATPIALSARPARATDVPVDQLAARIAASSSVGWSGTVQSAGSLTLPQNDSFATLGDLLGQTSNLRVWWRGPTDWRVDQIRSTGETDLFRQGGGQVKWNFESETATYSPVSKIRLPDASDVVPATLGRNLLQGVRPGELSALPARRVAGVDAAGLRLVPQESAGTVARVDLWVDPTTGLPLRVELYGAGSNRAVLTTTLTDVSLTMPDAGTTRFVGGDSITLSYEQSVDVAAEANALDNVDLPARLAGLATRDGADPKAVGVYGRGPTTMIVLPLRGSVARPLRDQLRSGAAAQDTASGTLTAVGPISVLLTRRTERSGSFLIAGTVTEATLQQAAASLAGASR